MPSSSRRIPGSVVDGALVFALPARRFRSIWMSIIIHSMQFVFAIPMILAIVLGLTKGPVTLVSFVVREI
jgi:hypothetical protein